jgi:DNA-binding response OmpR family regulator
MSNSTAKPGSTISTKRVLVADSSQNRFKQVVSALSDAGIDVSFAKDSIDFINRCKNAQPDLILINLIFDGSSSIELIKQAKQLTSRVGTKILVLSAHNNKENILKSMQAGATDLVMDPFEPRLLLQRIRYQLQEREAFDANDLRADPTQIHVGFQMIYDVLRIVSETKTAHSAIFRALKVTQETTKASRINVYIANLETNEAFVVAASDDEKLEHLKVDLEKYPEIREVYFRNQVVNIKDITANPLTKEIKKEIKNVDIMSMLVLPLRHRGETVGVMSLRFGASEQLNISEKHLKAFYTIGLAMAPKVAALKLIKEQNL